MAYEFTKLSEVPVSEAVSEECSVLVEDGGEIKRTAKANIGKDQVQADWNENDSSSPAYILNKPESLGGSVTWFSASDGNEGTLKVRTGMTWQNGAPTAGSEIINAFENGICRFNITVVSCCGTYEGITATMVGYQTSDSKMRAYLSGASQYGINNTSAGDYVTDFIDM